MHTVTLKIDDSIYEKIMGILQILPKEKIDIIEYDGYPPISFDEAQEKARSAYINIDQEQGILLEEAFANLR